MREPDGEDDDLFRVRFGAALSQDARAKGPCPDPDVLARFLEGEISDDQAREIRAHVDRCGVCDQLLSRLTEFDNPVEPADTDWAGIQYRIWRRVRPATRHRDAVFLRPARPFSLAYAGWVVVLVLLYPAYRGVIRPDPPTAQVAQNTLAVQSITTLDLNTSRSRAPTIRPETSERFFVLNFLVPGQPGRAYEATIQNEAGQTIARSRLVPSDALGNCSLLCDRWLFRPGFYKLVVKDAAEREERFAFSFSL